MTTLFEPRGWFRACLVAVLLTAGLVPAGASAKTTTLKIATLAPEGSTWWKLFMEAAKVLRDRTDGRVRVRLYAGGVAGDEPDVVRKMRVGRLHGAAVTSVGLSQIQPALLVLQAPGLFKSWEELDYVRNKMKDQFASLLEEKGFYTLMWGDVGFNRIFSTTKVVTPSDMAGTKPWCWTQDGTYQAFYEAMGVNPVLASVPDVLPGLQTGRMNAVTSPALVTVSFQWFTHMKYVLDHPQSVTIGAVVLTQSALAELSEEDKKVLFEVGEEFTPRLAKSVRLDERRAMLAVKNAGITIVPPDAAAVTAWDKVAAKGADAAAGQVYPPELLAQVREAVKEYRAGAR